MDIPEDIETPKDMPVRIRQAMQKLQGIKRPTLLKMMQGYISREKGKLCGCAGAFYRYATSSPWDLNDKMSRYAYGEGVERLSKDLGFETGYDLTQWVREHPDLWGNDGDSMFFSENAYLQPGEAYLSLTLDMVISRWLAVADRIEQQMSQPRHSAEESKGAREE